MIHDRAIHSSPSSWYGCALTAEEVGPFTASLGLRTENISGVGTQYTVDTFMWVM